MNGFRTLAALGIAATLAGCGQVAPPQGATPVHFSILTEQGGMRSGIFAATNIEDLSSQEVIPGPQGFIVCTAGDERGCPATFTAPPGSLLVALRPMSCAGNHLDTVYLENRVLTFVISWNNTCQPGFGTAAIPDDWIVAVPLRSLPQIQLQLQLDYVNGGDQYSVSKGLVDLRAPGPGHTRTGNFSLAATPRVVKGQREHIALTIFGLRAVRAHGPWRIEIVALDPAGRVIWHQTPYDNDPMIFKCLVGETYTCAVGSYSVEMPTVDVPPGAYLIHPSFALPAGYVLDLGQQAPSPPPFTLPSLTVDVVTG